MSSSEQRRFRRLTVRVLVDYWAGDSPRSEYATTLGAGGLFIETTELLDPGSQLKLRFHLPGGEELHELTGKVVWKRGHEPGTLYAPGMGVQFTDAVGAARVARDLDDLSLS